MDAVLTRFDESKARVRKEIREGMFHDDGTLRISEAQLRTWIADRAVDELKVVLQLSTVIARAGHLIPGHILVQVTEQVSDEARHFDILRALVPEELHQVIEEKVAALPAVLVADPHWGRVLAAAGRGHPVAGLLGVNIVVEGVSAAGVEELGTVPVSG